ncbi:MAG: tetratricopeptide repeat protein [Flavobacterium sp.]|uniref:tetratricopeptide repeat protein n=1 Tax=Flavobacterium sp. TaxID=239 RepID=UPI003BA7B8C1
MNLSEYTFLLNNPNAFNEKQAQELEKVVDNFPYFQSARALYLKGLYNQDSYKYNFALKKTAAYTTDRSVLFDFITSSDFVILEKDHYEQKLAQLLEIEVIEMEHVEGEKAETIGEISAISVKPTVEFESIDVDFVKIENKEEETALLNEVESNSNSEEISIQLEDSITTKINSEEHTEEIKIVDVSEVNEVIETERPIEQVDIAEKLEIGKPISFAVNEKHSFQEWLQLTSFKPINRIEETKKTEISTEKVENDIKTAPEKLKKLAIIDKFIETNPKITPAKDVIETPSKPIEISDTSHLMTETLARVYLEQKKYSKAIQAYEILILKYPEKSIFFADRIKDIKILQQNNQ